MSITRQRANRTRRQIYLVWTARAGRAHCMTIDRPEGSNPKWLLLFSSARTHTHTRRRTRKWYNGKKRNSSSSGVGQARRQRSFKKDVRPPPQKDTLPRRRRELYRSSSYRHHCPTTICHVRRRRSFGQPIVVDIIIYLFWVFCPSVPLLSYYYQTVTAYIDSRVIYRCDFCGWRKKKRFAFFVRARPSGREMFRHGWRKALWKTFILYIIIIYI